MEISLQQSLERSDEHRKAAASLLFQATESRNAWRLYRYRTEPVVRGRPFAPRLEKLQFARDAHYYETRANIHINAIGHTSCLPLCSSFYCALPRELRDMVYIYILDSLRDSRTMHVTTTTAGCGALTLDPTMKDPTFGAQSHVCTQGVCAAYFLDERYVGRDVRREMAEAWLRSTVFYFNEGWASLGDLLCTTRFGMYQPSSAFIMRVEIAISDYVLRKQCLECLGCLKVLGPGTKVTLSLDLERTFGQGEEIMVKRFEAIMEVMWESILCLADGRLRIVVWLDDTDSHTLVGGGGDIGKWVEKVRDMFRLDRSIYPDAFEYIMSP